MSSIAYCHLIFHCKDIRSLLRTCLLCRKSFPTLKPFEQIFGVPSYNHNKYWHYSALKKSTCQEHQPESYAHFMIR